MSNPPPRPKGPYEQGLTESRASRKQFEAKIAAARRRRTIGAALSVLLVLGLAGGGLWLWKGKDTGTATPQSAATLATKKCESLVPVSLWASQSMQPAAVALSKAFQAKPDSPCVDYQVIARKPMEAIIGLGPGQPNRPDGWIPDSPRWVDQLNAAVKLNIKHSQPFASSPLVVAMDPQEAAALDGQPDWLELVGSDKPIQISDPQTTTAGMLTLSSAMPLLSKEQGRVIIPKLAEGTSPSTAQLFAAYKSGEGETSAFAASEADLLDHNKVYPDKAMVAVSPSEGAPSFEYSLVTTSTNPAKAQGVEALRAFLKSPEASKILATFNLRATNSPVAIPEPTGSVGEFKAAKTPSVEQVGAAIDAWQSATVNFSLLAVFDVSGSMKEAVGKTTRIAVTQEAAGIALNALPATTRLGLWVFSIDKGPKGVPWKELVPLGELADDTQRAKLAVSIGTLSKEVGGGTGLYDTIWAAHEKVLANYDPQRVNAVVILTDGKNENPEGMSLDALVTKLKASDPKRPVAITTIGIGPEVDADALSKISQASHSDFYGAENPGDMTTVLARALFDHSCSSGTCV